MGKIALVILAAIGGFVFLTTQQGADENIGFALMLPALAAIGLVILFD